MTTLSLLFIFKETLTLYFISEAGHMYITYLVACSHIGWIYKGGIVSRGNSSHSSRYHHHLDRIVRCLPLSYLVCVVCLSVASYSCWCCIGASSLTASLTLYRSVGLT
jgi:hypothetical protein